MEMEQYADKIANMEDEMANKFTKTNQLEGNFQDEKVRLEIIKMMVSKYKLGISK